MHLFAVLRFLGSYGNLLISLSLGFVAMGLFWYHFPSEFVQLQRSASVVRDGIVVHAWSPRAESVIRFLLDERQVVLIGFVLATRLALDVFLIAPLRGLKARLSRG